MATYDFNFIAIYQNSGSFSFSTPSSGTLENVTNPAGSTFNVGHDLSDGSMMYPYLGSFTSGGIDYVVVQAGGGTYEAYAMVPDPNTQTVPAVLPGVNTFPFTVCYLEGTLIATPSGERTIETLAIGDQILTANGRAVPVKWIGRQQIRNSIFASPRMEPVCISAGALGNGLPHSDLYVTAAHGMIWHGLVVNAGAMVNGTTIRFVPLAQMPPVFTWYHIETEGHEEILAHGAPAETFVDYVGRSAFDNHQEYLDLYGVERIIPEMKRPRISTQRMLPAALRTQLGLPAHDAEIEAEATALLQRLKAA